MNREYKRGYYRANEEALELIQTIEEQGERLRKELYRKLLEKRPPRATIEQESLSLDIDFGELEVDFMRCSVEGTPYFLFSLKIEGEPSTVETYFGLNSQQAEDIIRRIQWELER